jgi:NADP-dependent 3-hydroxy acid dehydrogenase YdfG
VKLSIPLLAHRSRIVNNINSILNIIGGVIRLMQGDVSGRVTAYAGIAGINNGLMMTGMGAIRAFKK